jgi:hypothetical protein
VSKSNRNTEPITKEHAARHIKELDAGWMRTGAAGLTANTYAMLLGLDTATVTEYLRELRFKPFFCGQTQAVVWSKRSGLGTGYDEDGELKDAYGVEPGDPIPTDVLEKLVVSQNKLGPGVVNRGFQKPGKKPKPNRRNNGLYSYYEEYKDNIGETVARAGAVLPLTPPTEQTCVHCLYKIGYVSAGRYDW